MAQLQTQPINRRSLSCRFSRSLRRDWQLWVLLIPALVFFVIFCYFPMYSVQIAFRDYKAAFGITGSNAQGQSRSRPQNTDKAVKPKSA